jgi:hypothetical protein
MVKERRKHKRALLQIPIDMRSLDAAAKTFTTKTVNLSAGGFYCRLPLFVPVLTKLKISMVIPSTDISGKQEDHVITCEGMVVRTVPDKPKPGARAYEIACFFTDIDDYDRLIIEQYLHEKALSK